MSKEFEIDIKATEIRRILMFAAKHRIKYPKNSKEYTALMELEDAFAEEFLKDYIN